MQLMAFLYFHKPREGQVLSILLDRMIDTMMLAGIRLGAEENR